MDKYFFGPDGTKYRSYVEIERALKQKLEKTDDDEEKPKPAAKPKATKAKQSPKKKADEQITKKTTTKTRSGMS